MKKFFSFVAAALVAFSFTACNGNDPEAKGFKITVSDITATSAKVTVEPKDTVATYYWGVAETAQIAKLSEDTIQAQVIETINYYIEMFKEYGIEYTFEQFLSKGADEYEYTELTPNTEYTVYAFKIDGNAVVTGGVAMKNFKTPDVQVDTEIDLGELEDGGFDDWRDYDGSFSAYGASDTAEVGLTIFDEDFAGNFTEADLDAEYSYVWTSVMGENTQKIVKAEIVGTADEAAQTAKLAGWALCANGTKYKFSFTYSTVGEEEGDEAPAAAPKKAKAAKLAPAFNKHLMLKK